MVEQTQQLNLLFTALSDSTRRSILEHVAQIEMSIGEIAAHYQLTFAGISKHIKVLERAGLITKERRGREQVVIIVPATVDIAREHIERYAMIWGNRFDRLEALLKEE
ncbi:MAG: metalloregulator ArsR/SmtB family transcription factor [Candidatus Saccharimonadales bacterium]